MTSPTDAPPRAPEPALPAPRRTRTQPSRRAIGLGALLAALVVTVIAGLALGARDIPPPVVVDALLGRLPADDYEALVVLTERVPRVVLGLLIGACLGAAGAVMQAVTRNPLADPGILGIEAGAAAAVVIGIVTTGVSGPSSAFWFALAGAAITAVVVTVISRAASSTSPEISLVIAGAAVAALLASIVTLITVRDEAVFVKLRSWAVGSLVGRGEVIDELWVFAVIGLVAALALPRVLDAIALGDEVAVGLGVRVGPARLGAAGVGVLLAAAATAAIGPVAFVGLVSAHVARLLVGADHRWLLPYAILTGAVLLTAADVAARLVPGRGELEVGIMTAVVGAPFFVALARRRTVVPA